MSIYHLPDSFEQTLFSVPPYRLHDEKQTDRLIALSVECNYIRGTILPEKTGPNIDRSISYLNLTDIPQFSRYQKVEKLKLYLEDDPISFNTYLRLLEGLVQLHNIKHLELYGNRIRPCSPRILKRLKHLAPMFYQLESLKLGGIADDVLALIPESMPHLTKLEMVDANWQTLSLFDLPKLRVLTVNSLNGVSQLSQVTDKFRALRSLSISKSNEECITLGEGLRDLETLELHNICTLDLCGIAESKLCTLQIADCDLDPTPLREAKTLQLLSVKRCYLEQPMPPLCLSSLYELTLKDCCINDTSFIRYLPALQLLDLRGNPITCRLDETINHYPASFEFLARLPELLLLSMDPSVLDTLNSRCKPFAQRFQKKHPNWEQENQYIAK